MDSEEINALTDDQINVIADMQNYSELNLKVIGNYEGIELTDEDGVIHDWSVSDYCGNPSVIMPIVFKNGISLIKVGRTGDGGYCAQYCKMTSAGDLDSLMVFQSPNPLRAATLSYLSMKGAL